LGREGTDAVDDIRQMLHGVGFGGDWDVAATAHGSTGRAFVARRGDEALFVKLGRCIQLWSGRPIPA
jgi:hypothetical protein